MVTKPLPDFYPNKKSLDGFGSYCKKCNAVASANSMRGLREFVVAELGGRCVFESCGITDTRLLTIDHRHGGGTQIRKNKSSSYGYYKEMLGHLEDFQVLCWNHNHLKRLLEGEHKGGGHDVIERLLP